MTTFNFKSTETGATGKAVTRGILIPTLVLWALVVSDCYSNDHKKWDLEIGLTKSTYVIFEPIGLDVTLTNVTSDTLRTNGPVEPNQGRFIVDVKDSEGNTLEYAGPKSSRGSMSGALLLEPDEEDYRSFNLLELFGVSSSNSGYSVLTWRFPYLPPGTYSVKARFEDVASNTATFEIVEPTSSEKEALKLIEEASKIWEQRDSDPSAQLFRKVIERFPNSVFSERCYYLSELYSQKIRNEKREGSYDQLVFKRDLLMHYPNSGYCDGWLWLMTLKLSNKEGLDTLSKYAELYPNTRCARFAMQSRRQLEQELAREGKGR